MPSVEPRRPCFAALCTLILWTPAAVAWSQPAPRPAPAAARPAGVDAARLAGIDEVVARAIAARQLAGAVVVVGRGDTVVYEKAFGQRAVAPVAEPMTLDTIFDLASLTKPIATATSIALLAERGVLSLDDAASRFVPGVDRRITLRHLLEHTSGLPAADPLSDLTRREREILEHVALGESNKEVAMALKLTEKTVKHYMTNILQKLQVRNRVEASLLAHNAARASRKN